MSLVNRDLDTIVAVSTPPGHGGISVIRLSGPSAFSIARGACRFLPGTLEGYRIYFGTFTSVDGRELIDDVLVSIFKDGRSYTGEDVAEISCHGSPAICTKILNELLALGARSAAAGEFTFRAFMNGKLDLVQAEGVASLVHSRSQTAAKQAYRQLAGHLSKKIATLEDDIIWCMANLEAAIDFSTEDLDVLSVSEIMSRLSRSVDSIKILAESYRVGRGIKDGFSVALVGDPNAGKSSIFNVLVGEDRSIVTDIAGTTRDVVQEEFHYNGVRFRISDTAGIRDSQDRIERIGIDRSFEAMKAADLVVLVVDLSAEGSWNKEAILANIAPSNVIVVGNKSDLVNSDSENRARVFFEARGYLYLSISTLEPETTLPLKAGLYSKVMDNQLSDEAVISQARQYECLVRSEKGLGQAMEALKNQSSYEFIALELKSALMDIQEILGKRYDDQVMDRVFKEFCIGK